MSSNIKFGENSMSGNINKGIYSMVGKKRLVRTYSAGVWYGRIVEKCGDEIVLEEARRLWAWKAAKSISLSGIALYGIEEDKSIIVASVDSVWLRAIELIECTAVAEKSIELAADAEAN